MGGELLAAEYPSDVIEPGRFKLLKVRDIKYQRWTRKLPGTRLKFEDLKTGEKFDVELTLRDPPGWAVDNAIKAHLWDNYRAYCDRQDRLSLRGKTRKTLEIETFYLILKRVRPSWGINDRSTGGPDRRGKTCGVLGPNDRPAVRNRGCWAVAPA